MRKFFYVFTLVVIQSVSAQDSLKILTLDQCIEMALNRNISIKQDQNNLLASNSNKRQAYLNFLPNLNASYNYQFIDGSAINNSGQVVNSTSERSSPSVSSGVVLFNAFANHHLLNRRKSEFESARFQLEDTKISIRATVIRNYLNVLVDGENIRISTQRLKFLGDQLDREKKRVSVGVGNLETVYNFQSQVANEKLNNVNAQNQYQSDLLALLQSIQASSYERVSVAPLDTTDLEELDNYDEFEIVLADILQYSYRLKSTEAASDGANAQLKQVRSDRYPTLSLFGQHSRNFASTSDVEYVSQLRNNSTDFLQATVSIPIFNRYQTQNNIDNTKVLMLNTKLQNDQALLDVTNAAQRDYLDLVAAQTSYRTARENFDALDQTFEFIKKRFETGNTDFYNYLESLNNKNRAESQLINAQYTILLRKQILDLYRGK